MPSVLVTGDGYAPEHLDRLENAGFEVIHRREVAPADLRSLVGEIDAHVLGGSERLDADLLAQARRLQVISFVGTGIGSFVAVEAAAARGIRLCTTPRVSTRAVAEHTLGLLMGLSRGLFAQNEGAKRTGCAAAPTDEIAATPIGILGMGAVGEHVARLLVNAFGCRVSYANRTRKPGLEAELDMSFRSVEGLFDQSRAILILAATAPETKELVGTAMLSRGAPGKLLVNTAGAWIVEPVALRAALERGSVRAAAFDGYWIEPLPEVADDPYGLLRLPDHQFFVTPHTAARTPQTWVRMCDQAIQQVIDAVARQ